MKQKYSSGKNNGKKLNPFWLFLSAYLTYNLLGLVNMPWSIPGAYPKHLPWSLFLLGLLGCIIGYLLPSKTYIPPQKGGQKSYNSKVLGFFFLSIFIACLSATIVANKGIPLFLGEARFSNSPITFNLASLFGFWVILKIISDLEGGKKPNKLPVIIYCVGIISFGYRAPVLMFFIILFTYLTTFKLKKNKSIKYGVIGGVSFLIISAAFAGYRVSQMYETESFFRNIDFDYIEKNKHLAPLVPVLSMFDFSQKTISDIGVNLKSHMNGGLFISNYEALLPGTQWGARNIIGEINGARWVNDRPMSITPTLQGALYVDFGYAGVLLGFLAISSMICRMISIAARSGPLLKLIFCYFFSMSLLSIHSGYWDASILFFALFLVIIKAFELLKKNYPKTKSVATSYSHRRMPPVPKQLLEENDQCR